MTFEILCTTMHQKDFSKLEEMNVHANIVYANQADVERYDEIEFDGKGARMITTSTRGVGINRNLALCYAEGDICLLADDDLRYVDNLKHIILDEFANLPKADAIIFNVESLDTNRPSKQHRKIKKMRKYSRNPYGTFQIAIRMEKIRKKNIWFSPIFGGGSKYLSGEDSMFVNDMRKRGVTIYLSDKMIGTVKHEASTWFSGYNSEYYFSKGAFLEASHSLHVVKSIYYLYYACQTKDISELVFADRVRWMRYGGKGFGKGLTYSEWTGSVSIM